MRVVLTALAMLLVLIVACADARTGKNEGEALESREQAVTLETSAWFDVSRRAPPNGAYTLAFDSARGETIALGGAGPTLETWAWDGASWSKRTPATAPSQRSGFALAFDSIRGEVVFFGGYSIAGYHDETWVWNGVTWTRRMPATSPPGRQAPALAFDAARGNVVMFGGTSFTSARHADTWVWNGTTWTERMPASSPSGRYSSALAYDAMRSEVLLFGGNQTGVTKTNDTWVWNGTTWTQRFPAAFPLPMARGRHALAYDAARGRVVLFGGSGGSGYEFMDDVWTWDGVDWTYRTYGTVTGRVDPGLAYDAVRERVVLFGGTAFIASTLNDTSTWDGATWTTRAPLGREGHALVYDPIRREVVLIGGRADTWVWDGSFWTRRTPATALPPADYAATFDSARGHVLVFGGIRPGTAPPSEQGDTWSWNGVTWTHHEPANAPNPRYEHAIAFHAGRGEVVLHGGLGGGGFPVTDTWVWNGATWSPRPYLADPTRWGHALAYDAVRDRVVLFGGQSFTGRVAETWVWNGFWTQLFPAESPPARRDHALAFDSAQGLTVLYGGEMNVGTGGLADTWLWDGVTWTLRAALTPPGPRYHHAMAFDAARGATVLFGGRGAGSSGNMADTWLHVTFGGMCATDADCVASFCNDGVCCQSKTCATCATCAGTSPGRCTPVLNTEDSDTCAVANAKSCSNLGECKASLGTEATNAVACASGFLVDGVCCNEACNGTCQACRDTLKETSDRSGVCGAAKNGIDPRDSCEPAPANSCREDGFCDGRGGCRYAVSGTGCGASACIDNRATGQLCNGLGQCADSPQGVNCALYACVDGAGCRSTCASDTDCADRSHCATGTCVADEGASCLDERTVRAPDGRETDCGLFRCEAGRCNLTCARVEDCSFPNQCAQGVCVPFGPLDPGSSAGCATADEGQSAPSRVAFAFFFVAIARRRSRPESKAAAVRFRSKRPSPTR